MASASCSKQNVVLGGLLTFVIVVPIMMYSRIISDFSFGITGIEAYLVDAVRDLTSEQNRIPHVPYDVLELMREHGYEPKLCSRPALMARNDSFVVPNVVHFIYFGETFHFKFENYIAVLGVHKFIRPQYIIFHGDAGFSGDWWNRTVEEIPNMYHVWHRKPTEIHSRKIHFIQHAADITRLQIVYDFGGIYLDNDVLVVASFDPLRKYDFTLGREAPDKLGNGVIVARRRVPFLRIWLETYHNYHPRNWVANSNQMAHRIAHILPNLIHIEQRSLLFPNYYTAEYLYIKPYNWSSNYCVHLYKSDQFKIPTGPEDLPQFNSTCSEIMRYIMQNEITPNTGMSTARKN